MYEDVLAFEGALGVRFEWVLHVGDFGVWPDPERCDRATRRHVGSGDFRTWWSERLAASRRTLFIKGNHEDFVWLDGQPNPEVLPGLFYLRNGQRFELSDGGSPIAVGGVVAVTARRTITGGRAICRATPNGTTRATTSTR